MDGWMDGYVMGISPLLLQPTHSIKPTINHLFNPALKLNPTNRRLLPRRLLPDATQAPCTEHGESSRMQKSVKSLEFKYQRTAKKTPPKKPQRRGWPVVKVRE